MLLQAGRPCRVGVFGGCPARRHLLPGPLQQRQRTQRMVARAEEDPSKGTNGGGSQPPSGGPDGPVATTLPDAPNLQLPKDTIERLKNTVFGFDTFWVTSVENYKEDGVVFKGNVRGKDPIESFRKMKQRLKRELGDDYELFLMEDRDDKPTAVVLPAASVREGPTSYVSEVWLAVLFGVATVVTTMNASGVPLLQFLIDPFHTQILSGDVSDALPGAIAFWLLLGVHEYGHIQAAAKSDVKLSLPFFVPAGFGFLGSFGTITRFKGILPDRQSLLDISAAGPTFGAAASAATMAVGFVLTALGAGQFQLDTAAFTDSALVAVTAQAFLGDALAQPTITVHGLLVAGWAGLIVNALNAVPAGELDGGRVALALWGRKTANVVAAISLLVMGAAAIGGNSLSFYWVLLILLLQRGPVTPCSDELNPPADPAAALRGAALLALPPLVLLPYPIDLINAVQQLLDPAQNPGF